MRSLVIALGVLALVACENRPTATESLNPRIAFAGGVDNHSRASLVWSDSVEVNGTRTPSGIRGDGRDRFGQAGTPANEYQGDFCGVRGFIYDQKGESGDLEVDPDTYYLTSMLTACGSARTMSFYLGGITASPLVASPHILGTSIWAMSVGATKLVSQRFGMQNTTSCGELDFNSQYSGASNARLSRLQDVVDGTGASVRQWRLESQGNHIAACVKMQSNGKFVDSGQRYYLPFSAIITQVRYPSPRFP